MQIREMRAALSVGYESMGGLPDSAPDWVVTGLYELRTKAAKTTVARKAQRPAPRVGAIAAPKATDEAERLEMHRRIIQADLLQ